MEHKEKIGEELRGKLQLATGCELLKIAISASEATSTGSFGNIIQR
jgi:hypothetical protein